MPLLQTSVRPPAQRWRVTLIAVKSPVSRPPAPPRLRRRYRLLLTTEQPAPIPTSRRNQAKVDAIVEPTPDSPAAQLDGAFVQVSAQKSESAAKSIYRGLRVKFPAIFGKLHPNIQRADLGDKRVYYRVRVGPFALADAKKICGNYKAAGSDCVIARP